jgi:hypothetical protein
VPTKQGRVFQRNADVISDHFYLFSKDQHGAANVSQPTRVPVAQFSGLNLLKELLETKVPADPPVELWSEKTGYKVQFSTNRAFACDAFLTLVSLDALQREAYSSTLQTTRPEQARERRSTEVYRVVMVILKKASGCGLPYNTCLTILLQARSSWNSMT